MKSKSTSATVNEVGWKLVGRAKDSKDRPYWLWEHADDKGPFFYATGHPIGPYHTHLSGYRNLDALLKLKGLTKEKA